MWHLGVSWATSRVAPPSGEGWQTKAVKRVGLLVTVLLVASACGSSSSSAELDDLRIEALDVHEQIVELQEQVAELNAQGTVPVANTTPVAPAATLDLATALPDELLVLSAIGEFMPDGQVCEEQLLAADSPERGWEGGRGSGSPTWADGFEGLVVQITCEFESEEFWFSHDLSIRYPLKTGEAAGVINSVINSVVRSEVAKGILDYFNDSRERFSDHRLTEEEQRSDQTQHRGCGYPGYLAISGVVTYSNDGLYSVYLQFGQNHPCANTTASPVVTLNFDFFGKPDTRAYDRPRMLFDLPDLFKDDSGWEIELVEVIRRRWVESGEDPDKYLMGWLTVEFVRSLDFTMGPDTLVLHAQPYTVWFPGWCCGASPDHLAIPYDELTDYLDPDGPYRLILNN